ncbi:MAG: methyl-accepting chemotaxis protein [Rubrivivax sp.]|nr:MAG: methyl-accepting chemotaxis protein [Rubrivivax sp.]
MSIKHGLISFLSFLLFLHHRQSRLRVKALGGTSLSVTKQTIDRRGKKMKRPLTVTQRLALGFGLLLVLILLISAFAWRALGQSDQAMKTIYEDRTVPMGQLGDIRYLAARDRVILADAAHSGDVNQTAKRLAEFDKNRALANATWASYLATYLTPDEAVLARRHAADMDAYVAGGLLPAAAALRRADYGEALTLLNNQVSTLSPAAQDSLRALLDLQVRVAKETYEEASAENSKRLMLIVVAAIVSGVLATITTLMVTRRIGRQLGAEPHELSSVANRIASGDLTQQATSQAAPEGSVMAAMLAMRNTLNTLVHTVREGVDSVATASGQIAQGNHDLSSRTEEQASNLQQTAASMEQLNGTIQSTAGNAQNAQRLAQDAVRVARRTGTAMTDVIQTFDGIQQSSRRISDIIGVIDSIAFQTNILALNAAVEAARAGEQGRGFAVVATEVRSLAGRSADAAKQIKQLISESVQRIDGGSALISGVGETIREVVGHVESVSGLIAQIALEASEQSTGVAQIDGAMQQLDTTTQQNAALVEEAAAAAASLRLQASTLAEAVSFFKAQPALA